MFFLNCYQDINGLKTQTVDQASFAGRGKESCEPLARVLSLQYRVRRHASTSPSVRKWPMFGNAVHQGHSNVSMQVKLDKFVGNQFQEKCTHLSGGRSGCRRCYWRIWRVLREPEGTKYYSAMASGTAEQSKSSIRIRRQKFHA